MQHQERQGETQFTTKTEVPAPPWTLMFFIFLNLTLRMIKLGVLVCFPYSIDNFIIYIFNDQIFLQSHMT
jgi:ABC-type spermidine/putrescine transport system permease subunit II